LTLSFPFQTPRLFPGVVGPSFKSSSFKYRSYEPVVAMLPCRIGVRIGSGRQVTRHIGVGARKDLRERLLLERRLRRVTNLKLERPNGLFCAREQPVSIYKNVVFEPLVQKCVSGWTQPARAFSKRFSA
jgi:hypothetical protein